MASNAAAYVGMATGIIGAIAGIAGSIMGYIAYRHSTKMSRADRILELHKLRNATHVAAVGLVDRLPVALQSRRAVLNARGLLHSSMMNQFVAQHEQDTQRAVELAGRVPNLDANFDSLSTGEIDAQIVELDRTKGWIDELSGTYQASMEEDEKMRVELRANHRQGG